MNKAKDFFHTKVSFKEFTILVAISIIISVLFSLGKVEGHHCKYIGVSAFLLLSIFLSIENATVLFFLLVPNERLLIIPEINVGLLNLIVIIIFIRQLLCGRYYIKKNTLYLIIIFIFAALPSTLFGGDFIPIIKFIRTSLLLIMLYNISFYNIDLNYNNQYIRQVIGGFVIGTIIMGILGLIFEGNFSSILTRRLSGGVSNNPNDFSMLLLTSTSILYVFLKNSKKIYVNLIIIFILSILGLMTQSRTFIFGYFIIIIFVLLKLIFTKFKFSKNQFFISVFTLILFYFIFSNDITKNVFKGAWDRIVNPNYGDISGGRIGIWKKYINLLFDNKNILLFGIGGFENIRNNYAGLLKDYSLRHMAHNPIIELIVNYGILGLVSAITVFSHFFKLYAGPLNKSDISSCFYTFIPIVVLILNSMTRHDPMTIHFIVSFFLSLTVIKYFCFEKFGNNSN